MLANPNKGKKTVVVLCVLIVLVSLLGLPEFSAPISGDTAIYAYAGRAIAHGQLLYRDVWDFKAPGIYYLFALIFRLLPDSLLSLRLFAAFWGLAAGLMFWLLAKRFFTPVTALSLAGLFLLWTNLGGQLNADGPYPETFMPLLGILVYLAWFQYCATERLWWLTLAGMAGGSLILLKQTGALTLAGVGLIIILRMLAAASSVKRTLLALAALGLGAVIVLSPWPLYFWSRNAWAPMWQATVEYPPLYAATTSLRDAGHNALNLFLGMFPFLSILYFLVPLSLWLLWSRARHASVKDILVSPWFALTVWALLETLSMAAPRRFYERYLLQPLPALTMIAGFGLQFIIGSSKRRLATVKPLLIVSLAVGICMTVMSQVPRSLHWIGARVLSSVPTRSESMADYLVSHSDPSDTIFAWGDPRIPYVTHHSSGVKWINTEPFRSSGVFVTTALVAQVMSELRTYPPRFFVESPAITPLSKSYLAGTEVDRFIQHNYRLAAHVGDADLYEYNGATR